MATVVKMAKKPIYSGLRWGYHVLMASAVHTEEANAVGDTIDLGDWSYLNIVLDITASATDAGDVLDVYIDVSWDASTWYNAVHFTQQAGNGSAAKELAILCKHFEEDDVLTITSDLASGKQIHGLVGQYVRVRSTVVRVTGTDESHTFSVKAYVQ